MANVPLRTGEEGASYIIFKKSDCYWAKNASTGDIEFGGTNNAGGVSGQDASAVIQAALDALTPGRTWKEKVVLKGDFGLTKKINLVEYLILDIQGKLYPSSSFSDSYFLYGENKGRITIENGTFLNPNSISVSAIKTVNCDFMAIRDCYFDWHDVRTSLLYLQGDNLKILHNALLNADHQIITISTPCQKVHVIGNYAYNGRVFFNVSGTNPGRQIFIEHNWVYDMSLYFIHVGTDVADIKITNNYLELCGRIQLLGKKWIVSKNTIIDTQGTVAPIQIGGCEDFVIRDNILEDSSPTDYGIDCSAGTNRGLIEGNRLLSVYGVSPMRMVSPYSDNVEIKRNYGYTTENSGTAVIPLGDVKVAIHTGLVATPNVIKVTGSHQEVSRLWVDPPVGVGTTIWTAGPTVTANRTVYWEAEV